MSSLQVLFSLALLSLIQAKTPFANPFSLKTEDVPQESKIDYRLPRHIIPVNYNIKLTPKLYGDFEYQGESVIKVKVLENAKNITLHSSDLVIEEGKTQVISSSDRSIKVAHKYDEGRNFLILASEGDIYEGENLTITIYYTGKLNDEYRGFYRSSYINKDGKRKWLATTHFEPVGARRAFPCFDEPKLKATFDIKIDLKDLKDSKNSSEYKVISNMPIIEESFNESLKVFGTTKPMSTYLVAFVVCDFEPNTQNTSTTVWIRDELSADTDYARDFGKKVLEEMDKYVNIKYDLPKMDQIGIPDFISGAMENWGLVTYKEKYLVYNDKKSTSKEKQENAGIIAHEFAHQWFGDRVSPLWWKYLWLNEGFANFFQYHITDKIENFNMAEQFVIQELQEKAFQFDATNKTHPMNAEVESPSEISAIFDAISYQKSGSVIRMMQHFLQEEVFKAGLNSYLDNKKFDAAQSDDLFAAIDAKWKQKSIKKIMDTWVTQPGYPVITVTRDNHKNTITVRQERFLAKKSNETSKEKWWIPINYALEGNPEFEKTTVTDWLEPNETLTIKNVEPYHWVIFNKQQTGFYRVNYDDDTWYSIIQFLKSTNFSQIHTLNRAQLLDDAWNLARADYLTYRIAFRITSYLVQEVDYYPWYAAIRSLKILKNDLMFSTFYDDFEKVALNMSAKLVDSVGFVEKESDDHITKLKRSLALDWACSFDNKNCTSNLEKQFLPWLEDDIKNPIKPNLKSVVLCNSLKNATEAVWNKTYEKYLNSKDSSEKTIIPTALGCSRNKTILNNYLNLIVDRNSQINSTLDALEAIYTSSDIGFELILDFIIKKSHAILIHDKGDDANLNKLILGIAAKITTEEHLKKLNHFISVNEGLQVKAFNSMIGKAKENIEWLKRHEFTIGSLLDEYIYPEKSKASIPILGYTTILPLITVSIALYL